MRPVFRHLPILVLIFGVWGCGQKGAKLQKSVVPPDKTLFETGQEYSEKSQFIKARLAFQTLINTYPDSEFAAESYLAIGDSFYKESGTENLIQAEDQYKNFIIFFPTHPKAADAQLKVAALNMKLMRSPDRDPQYSYKAQDALKKFIQDFPDHPFIPKVKEYLKEVQDNLAEGDFGVGKYYAGKGNFAAARKRFKTIVDNYPNYASMDEAYFQLAQALEKQENSDEAAIYYGRIAQGFPFSEHFQEAKKRLEEMGKPIPEVDTQLAQLHEANRKPSQGFSPLTPIYSFARAIGVSGSPDPYLAAKKSVEEQAAASAENAAAGNGDKPPDDILIGAEIKKTEAGETQAKAVLGSNSKETSAGTDKNGGKRKEPDNKKKKNDTKKPS